LEQLLPTGLAASAGVACLAPGLPGGLHRPGGSLVGAILSHTPAMV